MQVKFNEPLNTGRELEFIAKVLENKKICGDGEFTRKSSMWMQEKFDINKVLLTTSCTHALEMAAILLHIRNGDEIIMPSYTFVSTANAFVLRGAKIVFVDIRPDTMNLDEKLIEQAITERTKAIVPVHYAGVSCNMNDICEIARRYHLKIVEDAAQGVMATYQGHALGTMGDIGCYSFHETKNYHMGEGGAILLNKKEYIEQAEMIREKGTDRSRFMRGQVDKYSWVEKGSSYLPSELNAAFLWAQLQCAEEVNQHRLKNWARYYEELQPLALRERIELPTVPQDCQHNAHMFYMKVKDIEERTKLIAFLKEFGIQCTFHYVPLHSSQAGKKYGEFIGEDRHTTKESERLLRLPMYFALEEDELAYIIMKIKDFFSK